jgi:hypothetical protein
MEKVLVSSKDKWETSFSNEEESDGHKYWSLVRWEFETRENWTPVRRKKHDRTGLQW